MATDKNIKDLYPVPDGKFSGGAGVPAREPDELTDTFNVLAANPGMVQNADAGTIAVAGSATPTIELDGEDWSDDAGDYIVKLGKYEAEVDTVTQSGGVTALKLLATPALSDYAAGEPIVVTVVGKLAGKDGYVAAGSIQLTGA